MRQRRSAGPGLERAASSAVRRAPIYRGAWAHAHASAGPGPSQETPGYRSQVRTVPKGCCQGRGVDAVISAPPCPARCVFTPVPRSIVSRKPPKPLRHPEGPPAPPDHGDGALTGKGTTVKGAGKELMVRRMKARRRKGRRDGCRQTDARQQILHGARCRCLPLLLSTGGRFPCLASGECAHTCPPPAARVNVCRPCRCEDFTRSKGVVGCVCWLSDCHTRPGSRLKMRSQVCVY